MLEDATQTPPDPPKKMLGMKRKNCKKGFLEEKKKMDELLHTLHYITTGNITLHYITLTQETGEKMLKK